MRSIPGMPQGDRIQVSSFLMPEVAKAIVDRIIGADASALTRGYSSNSSDLYRDSRPR